MLGRGRTVQVLGSPLRRSRSVVTAGVTVGVDKDKWNPLGACLFALEERIHKKSGAKEATAGNPFLRGGWAPAREEKEAFHLKVEGHIPQALHGGLFLRNGPSPQHDPAGRYHFFDGDGMVQSVFMAGTQEASSSSHLIQTPRVEAELKAGRPLWIKVGDMTGMSGLIKLLVLEPLKVKLGLVPKLSEVEKGQANTAFLHACGRLFAVFEASLPFELGLRPTRSPDGSTEGVQVVSLGYERFGGLTHPMTAHPKVDSRTGDAYFFGYDLKSAEGDPFMHHSVVSSAGALCRSTPVDLPEKVMVHDFALTADYSVLLDLPLQFQPKKMVKTGTPFHLNKAAPVRFGLLPRANDGGDVRWFTFAEPTAGFTIFHTMAAWDDPATESVVLFACRQDDFSLEVYGDASMPRVSYPTLWRFEMGLKTGTITGRQISKLVGEFPTVHPRTVGARGGTRFGYLSLGEEDESFHGAIMNGVAKFDLHLEKEVGRIDFGERLWGGETLFVPAAADCEGDEDDGYLLNILRDTATAETHVAIYDARTMATEPLAKIHLEGHVPFGFHTGYLAAADVQRMVARAAVHDAAASR